MEDVCVLSDDFMAIADAFGSLTAELQKELCVSASRFVLGCCNEFTAKSFIAKAEQCSCSCDPGALESAVHGILYLYRTALRLHLSGEQLATQLLMSSAWNEAAVHVIQQEWSEQVRLLGTSASSASQVVNIGQLIDMQWSLGMSMASSNCRNLNSPFVAMLLKVAMPSGSVIERSFEMTIPEFKNFSQQIHEMAKKLETS